MEQEFSLLPSEPQGPPSETRKLGIDLRVLRCNLVQILNMIDEEDTRSGDDTTPTSSPRDFGVEITAHKGNAQLRIRFHNPQFPLNSICWSSEEPANCGTLRTWISDFDVVKKVVTYKLSKKVIIDLC